jgi:hypothetical protein
MPKPPFAEGRSFATSPKRYAPSYSPAMAGAESSSLVSTMLNRLRNTKNVDQNAALSDWERDGGSVTETAPTTP